MPLSTISCLLTALANVAITTLIKYQLTGAHGDVVEMRLV